MRVRYLPNNIYCIRQAPVPAAAAAQLHDGGGQAALPLELQPRQAAQHRRGPRGRHVSGVRLPHLPRRGPHPGHRGQPVRLPRHATSHVRILNIRPYNSCPAVCVKGV